jgi:hypothetical protein
VADRLKYIKTEFNDDGAIRRDYKSVHFEGEGHPRDVEISAEERRSLYGAAHDACSAVLADAINARDEAVAARDAAQAHNARLIAECAELKRQLEALKSEQA